MQQFLKNFTSSVPVHQTIAEVEHLLIRCGVTEISKTYGQNHEVQALLFYVQAPGRNLPVRLPVQVDGVLEALWREYVGPDRVSEDNQKVAGSRGNLKKKVREDFRAQAERTAWRLMQDWVEIQMSMISLKQAETLEVFLPYIWDGTQTAYQQIKGRGFRGLLPEKTS